MTDQPLTQADIDTAVRVFEHFIERAEEIANCTEASAMKQKSEEDRSIRFSQADIVRAKGRDLKVGLAALVPKFFNTFQFFLDEKARPK
mgnify:CR=1 FL=1